MAPPDSIKMNRPKGGERSTQVLHVGEGLKRAGADHEGSYRWEDVGGWLIRATDIFCEASEPKAVERELQ